MKHHRSKPSPSARDKGSVAEPREVEVKLSVPDNVVDVLAEHLTSKTPTSDGVRRRHEVTTYFDTPDRALARGGMSVLIRSREGRHIQTLKADSHAGVAANRAEWEWPVEHDVPDPVLLKQTPMMQKLPQGLALKPVFSTDIDRTTRVLRLDGGTVVEAAYDEGVITTGEAQQTVRELELELREGGSAPLYRLALELHTAAPLTIETDSKAERGYRLDSGEQPVARKTDDVALERSADAADALRQILSATLGHLLANQPAALAGDAEGVHQMRVAVRRLRAALTLFQPHLEPHAAALFQAELRRIGQVFGEARDWDVFCLQILPGALEAEPYVGWRDLLLPPAAAAREAAHRKFAAEVRGSAFTSLVLGLAAWAEDMQMVSDTARKRSLEEMGPELLDRLARKVKRRGRHIASRSDTERHALRKSLKKLRYAVDFLRPVFPSKAVKAYLHACKKLQQSLGDINDTVTATGLAEHLAEGTHAALAPAVGILAKQLDRRRDEAMHDLAKRWKAFQATPRPGE